MRSFLAYILLFSIMLPTISPWGTIAYFHLNREYIAKVLCENRQRPELKCNGQCYLAKKLKQQEDNKDKETANRVQNLPVLQLFTQAVDSFKFDFDYSQFLEKPRFFYQLVIYISPASRLLRPPRR
ncbi:hypothetical protein SAMN04487995_3876 [Dyadobacter koreensis]|uniref:Uncharacterized protein n=2 Tax=Dyadobacter koreensis TaxID=408657 RepID=A0A1H6XR90_9BACT|nr:hypothetical protein SAMN04487995_3876 [Dyadobacter koreensis]